MLAIIVIEIMAYTIASFWLQYKTGVPIDSTLTTLFYSFWTIEIVGLTTIRVVKVKKENTETHNGSDTYSDDSVNCE